MANTNMPNGAVPVDVHGGYHVGSMNMYYINASYATALAVGDFVKLSGTANADGVPEIERAGATDTTIIGAIVGFKPDPDRLGQTHHTASTEGYAFVADDPDQLFSIQEDSAGGNIAVTAVGNNADTVPGTVTVATGMSNFQLDSSGVGTGTAQLRILRLDPAVDNEVGDYARWIVRINEHGYRAATGV